MRTGDSRLSPVPVALEALPLITTCRQISHGFGYGFQSSRDSTNTIRCDPLLPISTYF
jgi:hypothetical protein